MKHSWPPPGRLEPAAVHAAARRIRDRVRRTPLLAAPGWSARLGRPVHLKYEHLQATGSFKLRGAANFILALAAAPDGPPRGVVACSSGNHGRAVAWIAQALGIPATLCVPTGVDPVKLTGMRTAGAHVREVPGGYDAAEALALRLSDDEGLRLVHPFDDPYIVAGQGTVGLEILEDLGEGHADDGDLLVPLSGGGLAAGSVLALQGSGMRTLGVGAARAPVMLRSLATGRALADVRESETLASALSGGIGRPNLWTFPMLHAAHLAGTFAPYPAAETSIRQGVETAYREFRTLVEGGGATALAAFLPPGGGGPVLPEPLRGRSGPIVIVLSGGNLDPGTLADLLS